MDDPDFDDILVKLPPGHPVKDNLLTLKTWKQTTPPDPKYQRFLDDFDVDVPVEGVKAWEKLFDFPVLRKKIGALEYVDNLKTPKLGSSTTTNYRKTFKEVAFPEIAADVHQVHHAVPQKVYNNYPGIITQSELHSLENLRGIPKSNPGFHQTITNRWAQFYIDFPNFTRQQALDFAKQIDDDFGAMYIPPIR